LPQAPQFVLLVLVSTHDPLQFVVPVGQLLTHEPPEQTSKPRQVLPHEPQFELSDRVSTHAEEQRVSPEGHAQPPLHSWPVAHFVPQAPQFAVSEAVSTHAPAHSDIVPGQLQRPDTHDDPPPQVTPQAPQFDESAAVVTHLPPQNAWPDCGHSQRPDTHVVPPLQAVAQPPQFALSIISSTQAPAHSDCPVGHGDVASMPEPASITPPSGTGAGGKLAIQSRTQASSTSDSGDAASGIRTPQAGESSVSFSTRYDPPGSPGTTNVFCPQPFALIPRRRSLTLGDWRSRNSAGPRLS